ncbi:hypothetical protein ACRJ4W_31585 [Streptomyces sp. GLT-R25]
MIESVVTKRLDALPVAAEFLRRLDVAGIVDGPCPPDPRADLTHGQVIEVLAVNRLTAPAPLLRAVVPRCGLGALVRGRQGSGWRPMRVPAGVLTGLIGVLLGALAISVGVASGRWQQNVPSGTPPEPGDVFHGETPEWQSGGRAGSPGPPTRLILRQKSCSGSTSENHPQEEERVGAERRHDDEQTDYGDPGDDEAALPFED